MVEVLNNQKRNLVKLALLVFAIGLFAYLRGVNVFNFPAYVEDEGTYISQAWSLLRNGQLAPYTYWYDHAPAGWIFMALWFLVVPFDAWGMSVNAGRIFILLINVLGAAFLYKTVLQITNRFWIALVALLVFAVSPFALEFERRVLLDNIMVFWIILAMYFITKPKFSLWNALWASLLMGVAILTKETAIFFVPVVLLFTYICSAKEARPFSLPLSALIVFSTVFLYVLLALLKGELTPTGTFLGGQHPHVSLLESLQFQMGRPGGFFLSSDSAFAQQFRNWIVTNGFFVLLGIGATILNILQRRDKRVLFVALMHLSYWLYLIRGGVVLEWYSIPLVSLMSINIALALFIMIERTKGRSITGVNRLAKALAAIFLVILSYQLFLVRAFSYANQTINQVDAVDWIRKNVPNNAVILMDNYAYVDLHENRDPDLVYENAHYYWKADQDPEVRDGILKNDWENVDYLMTTRALDLTTQNENLTFVKSVQDNSSEVARFDTVVSLREPYEVKILRTNSYQTTLKQTWSWYKKQFIEDGGRVIDPQQNNQTTSEGQSYAMLRAVWLNDRRTFDQVWDWTQENMQKADNKLFRWRYGTETPAAYGDPNHSATDADQDIALALLFAFRSWSDATYLENAKEIIRAIWSEEVRADQNNRKYVIAGDWAKQEPALVVNPSYLSPYAYRIFAEVDPAHDWRGLVDDSYEVLDLCSRQPSPVTGDFNSGIFLPVDWCFLTQEGNVIRDSTVAESYGLRANTFSFDAMRVFWRVGLDYLWFNAEDERSLTYLLQANLWTSGLSQGEKVFSQYDVTTGEALNRVQSLANYANLLAMYAFANPEIANGLFHDYIFAKFVSSAGKEFYWGDANNYYDQNWVWFGTGLYTNTLPNLWNLPE